MEEKKSEQKGNVYDRLLKSHIQVILKQVFKTQLKIEAKFEKRLTDKIQKSREREVDYAAIFVDQKNKRFILHIELQSNNDPEMLNRMGEYHTLMVAKYKLPIIHYVVYVGKAKFNMKRTLPKALQYTGFRVLNYQEFEANYFLNSDQPEEVIQAILGKHEDSGKLLEQIINRIIELSGYKNEQTRYLHELRIYSKLRKLDILFDEKLENMPITFDENLEEDIYYQKGKVIGMEQGMEQGVEQEKRKIVFALLQEKMDVKLIARVANVSEKYVLDIMNDLPKE